MSSLFIFHNHHPILNRWATTPSMPIFKHKLETKKIGDDMWLNIGKSILKGTAVLVGQKILVEKVLPRATSLGKEVIEKVRGKDSSSEKEEEEPKEGKEFVDENGNKFVEAKCQTSSAETI